MKDKKLISIGAAIGIMLGAGIIAYAITSLFATKSQTSDLSKKMVFQFDLSTGLQAAEVGPGDSISVNPTVYNDATEGMYVFIVVDQPACGEGSLYTYTAADTWELVSSTNEKQIYAYAGETMTALLPGETTDPLTALLTMQAITNAEYSLIDDINITITAYAIGTDGVSETPAEAWAQCKNIGKIQ